MSGRKLVPILAVFVAVAVTASLVVVKRRDAEGAELRAKIEQAVTRGQFKVATGLLADAKPGLLDPDWASLHRGEVLILQRGFPEAKGIAEEILSRKPDSVEALTMRAQAISGAGYNEQALPDLAQALKLSPKNPDVLAARALVYVSLKQDDKAIADLEEAVTAAPEHLMANKQRCVALFQAKRNWDARKSCEMALKVMPTDHRDRGFMEYALQEVLQGIGEEDEKANEEYDHSVRQAGAPAPAAHP